MKLKLVAYLIILTIANINLSVADDCNKFDKLSKEYAKCLTLKAKEKGGKVKDKIASDENKNKLSNIKSKLSK